LKVKASKADSFYSLRGSRNVVIWQRCHWLSFRGRRFNDSSVHI
jgi:hypothetical protein